MPGQPGPEHDLHFACGRGHGAQLQDRASCGFAGEAFGAFARGELLETGSSAAAGRAFLASCSVFGDDAHVKRHSGCVSLAKCAVGGRDENAPQLLAVAGAHLHDARIVGAGGAIGAQNQLETRGEVEVEAAEAGQG